MKVVVQFELDSSWDSYKDTNPELLIEDLDLIQKEGVSIVNYEIV